MKKWTAAIYLAVVFGIFAGSGVACGYSSGCVSCDKEDEIGGGDETPNENALATPVVTLDGNLAVWEPIEGAIGYGYKINNGSEKMVTSNVTSVALKHGQTIKVRALAENPENDGDWSNEVTFTASGTLSAVTLSIDAQGFASWTAVQGASGYEYLITDEDETTADITGTTTKTVMDFALKVGQSIAVRAIGDGIENADSDWCQPTKCTSVTNSGANIDGGERPPEGEEIKPGTGGEEIVFDESKLGNKLNYKTTFTAEVGERANIPVVYVQYDGAWYKAFPWVTCGNEKVEVGGRGTRFYTDKLEDYIIDYYVEIGGVQKIATTTVTIKDTQGPTFSLPASADGMLVYVNEEAALPDWTAFDYSGIQGGNAGELYSQAGVSISVTYNGTPITVTNGKFTPTQFGIYKVTYTAQDTKGNVGTVTFNVECARMVEICNFDSLEVGSAWQYHQGVETLGELSTEHRYGNEGHSLKVTTRGTGEGGFIKVIAIPNYFDLSGFDEIAFNIYATESLGGISAGIYLLNNEALYRQPYNLEQGENIVRFTAEEFAMDYEGGKIMNSANSYRSSDHIWLQFRGPEGVDLYIDNMVGIFYAETGTDREAPMVDLGAGAAIAESAITNDQGAVIAAYKGAYGNISVVEGDTIKSAIDKHVHVCDNSMSFTWDYTVTKGGVDVTSAVKNGTQVGALGETYILTVTASDNSGNTTTKSEEIVVRQKFPTYTKVGMEEVTLNRFNSLGGVKVESTATVKLSNQIDKNGKVEVKTVKENEVMYLTLQVPEGEGSRALTATDVNLMEYINLRFFVHDAGLEFSLGNGTALCRSTSGWNNITIDKATFLAAMNDGTYNTTTGELKLNLYCALGLPFKVTVYEAKGVYAEGNMPFEKELPLLDTPVVTIDPVTGIATWEAIENAVSYTVYVNGVEQTPQTTTSYQLQDEDMIVVRANGDGVNYDDGSHNGISIAKTYYIGKVMLNDCEDLIYFDGPSKELSTEHVKEGKSSVKITSTGGWQTMTMYMRIDDKALSQAQWMQYEYVEMSIYAETAGVSLYVVSSPTIKMTPIATLEQGDNTVRLSTKDILEAMDAFEGSGTPVYSSGFLFVQFATGGTVYFDKIMAVIGNGSAYVPPQTDDDDTTESSMIGIMLNKCDAVGGWIATNGTTSIETLIKTQGAGSIKVEALNGNYINIYVRDYANGDAFIPKAQLMAYDFFYMDVYNGNASDVTLYMRDGTTVAAYLKAGEWTSVSFSKDMVNTWFDDNAGDFVEGTGAYNTFYVKENATLYFDNVLGCMQADNPDFVVGENGLDNMVNKTLLNGCEAYGQASQIQFWVETNATASLDTTVKTQGTYSIKTVGNAWNYINVYMRDSGDQPIPNATLATYDYISIDIFNANATEVKVYFKDAGGDNGLGTNGTVACTLAANAWTTVTFDSATITQWFGNGYCTFYLMTDNCTLYFDNVSGCTVR